MKSSISGLGDARSVVRLTPAYREGPNNYLMRVAHVSGLSTNDLVAEGFGYGVESLPWIDKDANQAIRDEVAAIQSHKEQSEEAWLRMRARICPTCIATGNSENTVGWELRYADACVVHGSWLVDQCNCGAAILPLRDILDKCTECSVKLGSLQSAAAPPAVIDLSLKIIEKCCVHPAPSNRALRTLARPAAPFDLNLVDFQNLAGVIGLYGDPNAPLRSTNARSDQTLRHSWSITSIAAEVLQVWPSGFRRLLDWLRSQNDDGTTHRLGHRFGRLYDGLFRGLSGSQFECVHQELEKYLLEFWPALLHRANGRFGAAHRPQRWVMATEVEDRFGISRMTLEDLVTRGALLADRRTTPTGRTRLMIERESLEAFEASNARDVVSLTMAAHVLGISEKRLRGVITQLLPGAWRCSNGQWRIPKSDVHALINSTAKLPSYRNNDASMEITLNGALRYLNLTDQDLIWIVEAVRNHTLDLVRATIKGLRGISAWLIDREKLRIFLMERRERRLNRMGFALSLPELAKRWRIKQEVIYRLHKDGYLRTQKIEDVGYRGQIVLKTEMDRFEHTFISARRLAHAADCSAATMISRLRIGGVHPIDGGDGSKFRQAFYRRVDCTSELLRKVGIRRSIDQMTLDNDPTLSPVPQLNAHSRRRR